ncbi:septation protein SepH [Rhodococcus sp. SGAir0479]|uniref:septation protein SepH n=1 Tax=Rhodococcus sp. SGAir0479 TaxID=2567884 RepID=UPI0015861B18|nr:septation protein SepH [Rhodococcus sp. SGAir0479]
MRELRVIGLEPGGAHVVCSDPDTGEKFRIAADDKLRAASRGDIARLGQIEIETDCQMRPREIQARIRAGASVDQVAAEAGVPHAKVERFAYPVLLERSRAAEMAQAGHPLRPDGPAVNTLGEIVAQAFRARGHDIDIATWDAWKEEGGHWVAQLQWQAGRTTNTAHWRYQPDAHGGTITALDDTATQLVDPDFGRPLRGLAPVPMEGIYGPADIEQDHEHDGEPVVEADSFAFADSVIAESVEVVEAEVVDAAEQELKVAPQHSPGKDKRGKPALPSWDDVLLGVRSNGRG